MDSFLFQFKNEKKIYEKHYDFYDTTEHLNDA